jgi:hypothetical protein
VKRRVWPWAVAGAIVILLAVATATVVNSVQRSPGMLSNPDSSSKATPKELFTETVRQTQDMIDVAGEPWYFDNGLNNTVTSPGKPWTNPPTTGYSVSACGAS